jgi:glycogen debranching enzyme
LVEPGAKRKKPVPDATLLLFEVARVLRAELPANDPLLQRQLYPALVRAFLRMRARRRRHVWMSSDGLIASGAAGAALTWMDAHIGSEPITPRRGLAIELQALWTKGCETLAGLAREYGHTSIARAAILAMDTARAAFRARFWCHDTDYPYDVVSEPRDTSEAWADSSIRPNAVIALAIDAQLFDAWQARAILQRAKSELVTPRGLRSLTNTDGRYAGHFTGSTEECELAYHQGTAWTFLLGFYARASLALSPDEPELQSELKELLEGSLDGCTVFGQLPQLADGDAPHRPRGSPAQASSVAEVLRALLELEGAGSA